MITRIEIDGFKTFQNFSLDLAPFQVIIGPNGCGKSNLLDALHMLSKLAGSDLRTAFREVRGEPFTILPADGRVKSMRLGIEFLVGETIQDDWGEQVKLRYRRLRYDVEIGRGQAGQLSVLGESLRTISPVNDRWSERYGYSVDETLNQAIDFINTTNDKTGENTTIYLNPENNNGKNGDTAPRFIAGKLERTLLSRVDTTEYPHVLAAQNEMLQWHILDPNPELLRLPSMLADNDSYIGGNSIPFMLAELKTKDRHILRDISRYLGNMVPGIVDVEVIYDDLRNEYNVFVNMQDGRRIFQSSLSEGTLRLLQLITIRNNPAYKGLLCLEEPENGVHPAVFKRLVRLLREMATDFNDPEQAELPLRQVLATTHSPTLVSQLDLQKAELLFAEMVTRIEPGVSSLKVTRITPVRSENIDGPQQAYALHRVIEYLNNDNHDDMERQIADIRETMVR